MISAHMIRLILFVLIGLSILYFLYRFLKGFKKESYDYISKQLLLSRPEQVLFKSLLEAFPDHHIFPQVSLNQIVQVQPDIIQQSKRAKLFNMINGRVVDFVVCNKDFSVNFVIELDDKSHLSSNRKKSDAKKEAALSSCGVRLVRYSVSRIPTADELRALL